MMKDFYAIVIIGAMCLTLSCNNTNNNSTKQIDIPAGWINIEGENYSLYYPPGWFLDRSGQMGTTFLLFSPEKMENNQDEFKENISLMIEKIPSASINLEAYIKSTTKQIKEILTSVEILQSEEISVSERHGHKMVYTGTQGTLNLKFMQYFFIENQQAYVLTFSALAKDFESYETSTIEIMNTFQLK